MKRSLEGLISGSSAPSSPHCRGAVEAGEKATLGTAADAVAGVMA